MNKKQSNGLMSILGASVFITMIVNLYLIFLYAPTHKFWDPTINDFRGMGHIQRIFYFHVPSAWVAGLACLVVFIASIFYLWKRDRKYDIVAQSSGEIGVLFMTIFLTTGPIWAKPVWEVWWDWSPRLTLSLLLWFIFVAYLMVHNFVENEERGARFASVFGIVGFLNVPIVYMSIRLWDDIHPRPVIGGGEKSGLDPDMRIAFYFSLFTFTVLFLFLLIQRVRLQKARVGISELKKQISY